MATDALRRAIETYREFMSSLTEKATTDASQAAAQPPKVIVPKPDKPKG